MRAISLDRARSIVGGAEDYFSRRAMDSNYFIPFRHAGAVDRPEAIYAMLLAIAEYRQGLPQNNASERSNFNQYVRHSQSVVLHIILDSDAPSDEQDECKKIESIESFVGFLDSTDLYASSFWPSIYQRLGLEQPIVARKQKPWWRVW